MLTYGYIDYIAKDIYDSLDIPEDIYLTFNKESLKSFRDQYLKDTSYLYPLVDAEIEKYDTSENNPSDIEDIRESAKEEIERLIEANIDKYYQEQHNIVLSTYREIVQLIKNSAISNVIDIDEDYYPEDPEVGFYHEERTIDIKLSNGAVISMYVKIDEDEI